MLRQVIPWKKKGKIHRALILCSVPLLIVVSQASGLQGLVRVLGTVPICGNFNITDCPGCNIVRCSPLMEGEASDAGFAKSAQLIGPIDYLVPEVLWNVKHTTQNISALSL